MPNDPSDIPALGALPENYQEVLYWTIKENPSRLILLQILAVPLLLLSALIFSRLAVSLGKLPSPLTFGPGDIGIVILAILLTIVLHELAHGMTMQMFGARPRYGVLWKQAMFYATAPGYAFRRNDYLQIALAPVFVLSVLVILGMWLLSGTFWVAVFAIAGVINGSGAIGDLWVTTIVLRYPATAYVMDEKDGIRVFVRNP
jgi:Putative zincin peptidase